MLGTTLWKAEVRDTANARGCAVNAYVLVSADSLVFNAWSGIVQSIAIGREGINSAH